ncbi:GNAT family N-acetyltransferase [Pelosinus sp. sgz500959]|uniref:bifunctional helix-turn-helix transcriptional regulator/GNAT family N-acetyltransferase n=1 Tax=Pelosinus sp. sgz500959 TaxID=3242472 RepID=UPI00366AF2A3
MLTSADIISNIRGFNRFYTNILGLLDQYILDSGYSLTEARVLFEISKTEQCTANTLVNQLGIDRSYMSRMILKFERNGLVTKTVSETDTRVNYIQLTDKGWQEFKDLNEKSNEQIKKLIEPLSDEACIQVHNAMNTIKRNLSITTDSISIRPFTPSDIDYVISRHKALYREERNLSSTFDKYVDESIHHFVQNFDEKKECMFILECNGSPAGCVAIMKADEKTAQFRYYILEPEMRGRGLGHKLIDMALDFCRQKGYQHVFLLTMNSLKVARHLYKNRGFKITKTYENPEWGKDVLEERWDLDL